MRPAPHDAPCEADQQRCGRVGVLADQSGFAQGDVCCPPQRIAPDQIQQVREVGLHQVGQAQGARGCGCQRWRPRLDLPDLRSSLRGGPGRRPRRCAHRAPASGWLGPAGQPAVSLLAEVGSQPQLLLAVLACKAVLGACCEQCVHVTAVRGCFHGRSQDWEGPRSALWSLWCPFNGVLLSATRALMTDVHLGLDPREARSTVILPQRSGTLLQGALSRTRCQAAQLPSLSIRLSCAPGSAASRQPAVRRPRC